MKALEGKVAVITGGSSGIGLATAKLFQQAGAKVAISGRNQKSLDDAAKELGPKAITVRSDVSRLRDLDTLFDTITKKLGHIDGQPRDPRLVPLLAFRCRTVALLRRPARGFLVFLVLEFGMCPGGLRCDPRLKSIPTRRCRV